MLKFVWCFFKRLEKEKLLLTGDASQYFWLLKVKSVRGIGRQMFAYFRALIKFVFVDSN